MTNNEQSLFTTIIQKYIGEFLETKHMTFNSRYFIEADIPTTFEDKHVKKRYIGFSFVATQTYQQYRPEGTLRGVRIDVNYYDNNKFYSKSYCYTFTPDVEIAIEMIHYVSRRLLEFAIDEKLFLFDSHVSGLPYDIDNMVLSRFNEIAMFLLKRHDYRYFDKLLRGASEYLLRRFFNETESLTDDDDVERTAYLMNLKHELCIVPETDEMIL